MFRFHTFTVIDNISPKYRECLKSECSVLKNRTKNGSEFKRSAFRRLGLNFIAAKVRSNVQNPKQITERSKSEQNLFQNKQNRFGTSFVFKNTTYLSTNKSEIQTKPV